MTTSPVPRTMPGRTETAPRTALITGASAGIGAAFADRLAHDGYNLIVVARRRDRLEALANRLRAEEGVRVDVLAADLTDPAELLGVETAIEGSRSLEVLVNCAGVAGYMPFVELPPDDAEALIGLHVTAMTRLTRAALPGMIVRGSGAVINVASALAFSASIPAPPLPYRAVYAGAKSYMVTFTELLALELRETAVRVQALCPGVVRTELHEVAGYDVSHIPFMMEPDDVVTASLAGLELGEVVCLPSVADADLLAKAQEARTRVFEGARSSSTADRYGTE